MRRSYWLLALLALPAIGLPGEARAASFDCAKAQKPDEMAICSNPGLSVLDSEMGALFYAYDSFPLMMGASGARSDDAHAFLSERGKCGAGIPCLQSLYAARIKTLQADIKEGAQALGGAADDASSAGSLPAPVEETIAGYAGICRKLGGNLKAASRPSIMAADFDGDGVMDYLLNPQNVECDGAATAFCGNGGCNMDIALSSKSFEHPVKVMGGSPTIAQGPETIDVEVWVDGSHCNVANYEKACWATYSWNKGKAAESFKARPLPN